MKKLFLLYIFILSNFCFSQSLNEKTDILTSNKFIYLGIFLVFTLLLAWQFWKRNKNILVTNKPEDIFPDKTKNTEKKQEEINEFEDPDISNYISNKTATAILKRLVKFERDHKYLKKDITLTWVANHLGTNTKYLSETIKIHRGKNFNNYINGLRISYITYMLYKKPEYREYKVVSLAKECGYSSSQVFVIAFKKENGIPPSYFIANLKDEKSEPKISLQ